MRARRINLETRITQQSIAVPVLSNDDLIIKPDAKAATAAQAVHTRLHLIQHVIPAVRCIQEL